MMVLVRSAQMVHWRDRYLEMSRINAQSNTPLFWHSCRRRLFRRLCSELYSSTDNKRSGKTLQLAVRLPVSFSFFMIVYTQPAVGLFHPILASPALTLSLSFSSRVSVCATLTCTQLFTLRVSHCLCYPLFSLPSCLSGSQRDTKRLTHT